MRRKRVTSYQREKQATIDRFDRSYWTKLATECGGNVSEMARRSGMERAHVRGKCERLGIEIGARRAA